jgi:hypothetical protein
MIPRLRQNPGQQWAKAGISVKNSGNPPGHLVPAWP